MGSSNYSESTVNHVTDASEAVVDITNSPPHVLDLEDSSTEPASGNSQKTFQKPQLPAGITMRPASPDDSVMEVGSAYAQSIIELPGPSSVSSVMEVQRVGGHSVP